MKKINFKRTICAMMALVMMFGMVACGNKDKVDETAPSETEVQETVNPNLDLSMGDFIKETVVASMNEAADIKLALSKVVETGRLPFDCVVEDMPADAEYLPGFKSQITGYTECAMMAPMISTQPFVVYMFNTDDVPALVEQLKAEHDMRWNICTEANYLIVEEFDGAVLFGMLP